MSTSIESHRIAPVLRALCVVAGLMSGALAFLFFWLVATPDRDVGWLERLGGLWLAAAFSWATWVLAVSAVRGRSPHGVPVRAPWRTVAADLRFWIPAAAVFVAFKIVQARVNAWAAFGVAMGLALVIGLWRETRRTAKTERSDGSSS